VTKDPLKNMLLYMRIYYFEFQMKRKILLRFHPAPSWNFPLTLLFRKFNFPLAVSISTFIKLCQHIVIYFASKFSVSRPLPSVNNISISPNLDIRIPQGIDRRRNTSAIRYLHQECTTIRYSIRKKYLSFHTRGNAGLIIRTYPKERLPRSIVLHNFIRR